MTNLQEVYVHRGDSESHSSAGSKMYSTNIFALFNMLFNMENFLTLKKWCQSKKLIIKKEAHWQQYFVPKFGTTAFGFCISMLFQVVSVSRVHFAI